MKKLFTGFTTSLSIKLNFVIEVFLLFCLAISSVSSQPLQLGQSVLTSFEYNNPNYKVVKVLDTRNTPPFIIGGSQWSPTQNSGSNWAHLYLGNVFGITLDDNPSPNIFVARSTVYCDHNNASIIDSAIIYRLDGVTWTQYAYIIGRNIPGPPQVNVNWIPNTGSGLGNLCYDKWHKQIFVTNHEDGRIYRIKDNGGVGEVKSWYDPFYANNDGSRGFAPLGERLWGIGVNGTNSSDVRVYFATWSSDRARPFGQRNKIFSIALDNSGNFILSTLEEEIELPLLPDPYDYYSNPVSDIEFSSNGEMLLGERTMFGDMGECIPTGLFSHNSRMLEYRKDVNGDFTINKWYKIGYYIPNQLNSAGGVDFNFGQYDSIYNINSECDSLVVGTGDALLRVGSNSYVYGIQITNRSLAENTNIVDYSQFVDIDNDLTDSTDDKTSPGDIDVYRKDLCSDTNTCMTILRDTTYCDSTETYIYEFQVRNNSYTKYLEQLEITVDSPQPPNYVVTLPSTINVSPSIPPRGASQVYKVKLIGPGAVAYAEVCYTLSAQFEHDDCPWCCFIENCIKLPICSCAEVLMDSIYCSGDGYAYKFKLQNGTHYDVTKIQLTSPGSIPVTFVPQIFHFGTPIAPGQLFPTLTAQMIGGAAGQTIPVRIKLFSNDFECCYFELSYTLPPCDTLLMNLRSFIEGRYDPATNTMIGSNVEVELRNSSSPYSLVESSAGYLNSSGNCELKFYSAQNGVNYYIVLKNSNSLETWSKSPGQSFNNDLLNYNFLTVAQAYGMNLELIDSAPLYYGILSGDVNQDGEIDLTDVLTIYNDATIFTTGNSDLNGDGGTDLTDIVLAYNNALDFAAIVRP